MFNNLKGLGQVDRRQGDDPEPQWHVRVLCSACRVYSIPESRPPPVACLNKRVFQGLQYGAYSTKNFASIRISCNLSINCGVGTGPSDLHSPTGCWRSLQRPLLGHSILLPDEAKFYLDGVVNKHNCRIWSTQNPHASVERVQFAPSINEWCGVSTKAILGPFFFEDGGRSVTVTTARYQDMLVNFVLPELRRRKLPLHTTWFQQDPATPHTAASTMTLLRQVWREADLQRCAGLLAAEVPRPDGP